MTAGLSDWDVDDLSFEARVQDLADVVDALGLNRFALLGISQGGPTAVESASRHPERVSHLVLLGGFARGWGRRGSKKTIEVREAMITLVETGWGQDNPAFRQMWTTRFVPDGTVEQHRWFNELQRITTSPENAANVQRANRNIDVRSHLQRLRVPTLILHARGDAVIPYSEGQECARLIPGARFVTLDSRNHLLLEDEPAFRVFVDEIRSFLGHPRDTSSADAAPPSAQRLRLREGTRLGHYEIGSPIGAGSMGIVYRATDLKRFSNRPCTTWGGRGTFAHTDAGGPMRAYSMDLRERALLDSDAGMKAADVAAKYRVSGSWVRLLKQRRRETGEVAPRVQRHGRRCMLEPHLHTLAALIAAHPDRTLAELQDALATPASVPTVWRAVRALGLTVKKNGPPVRTRSA